jgi:hypothetical protein
LIFGFALSYLGDGVSFDGVSFVAVSFVAVAWLAGVPRWCCAWPFWRGRAWP